MKEQRCLVDRLCAASAEVSSARELALSFLEMVRGRQAERLDGWMSEVVGSGIGEFQSLADSLAQTWSRSSPSPKITTKG